DSQATLNIDRLGMIKTLFGEVVKFVQEVYVPDATAIAGMYADWFKYGAGVQNYLAVPDLPLDSKRLAYDLPGGYITGGDLSTVAGRKITVNDLQSSLGRHVARCIRTAMLSELAEKHFDLLVNNIGKGDTTIHVPPQFPSGTIEGVGTHEAPRGTLSHWVVV